MKSIFTVQHTQSEHHTNGMVGSWTDWNLTELGKQQAERIAIKLKQELDGKNVVGRRIFPVRRPRSRFLSVTPTVSTERMFIGFMKHWLATNSWKSLLRRNWSM